MPTQTLYKLYVCTIMCSLNLGLHGAVPADRVGANTSTQYLGTSTLKMFKYKYKYRVLQNVFGYYPSTLQMYLGTIIKFRVQMYNITHKNIPVNETLS